MIFNKWKGKNFNWISILKTLNIILRSKSGRKAGPENTIVAKDPLIWRHKIYPYFIIWLWCCLFQIITSMIFWLELKYVLISSNSSHLVISVVRITWELNLQKNLLKLIWFSDFDSENLDSDKWRIVILTRTQNIKNMINTSNNILKWNLLVCLDTLFCCSFKSEDYKRLSLIRHDSFSLKLKQQKPQQWYLNIKLQKQI